MNAVSEATERVALYYREGSSDKVYQAAIEPAGNQFVVNFAYGRRGATLTTGTKTSSPVDYAAAKKIYAKLVGEKKAKGYTEGADGTPYQHTDKQASGILPQLLNPVEEAEVELLLRDDNYCAQEKFDGRHLLVRKQDDDLEGINKKGFVVGLPQTMANDLRQLPGSFIPDGESIGDDYHAFDLLEHNGENLRPLSYRIRLVRLVNLLLSTANHPHVKLVETAFTTAQKTGLWQRLRRENREGIVFKRLDAPFAPGKPNSGGPQLKFKFVATLSAVVAKINVQRSVEVGLVQRA
jgi:bifunctional non-homologous end joining protein LigD